MDYVVGSVAALVTGNVTPSRPRMLKRALTPTKHQPSPNVTPKSESVDDRSIFLSPSVQKKKAIVKKSPKRIFQNPDLETTGNGAESLSSTSPKADKVKKHLKDKLDSDMGCNKNTADAKAGKQKEKNKRESVPGTQEGTNNVNVQSSNENTPRKKKKKNKTVSENSETTSTEVTEVNTSVHNSPKKMKQRRKSVFNDDSNKENAINEVETEPNMAVDITSPTKQKKKSKVTVNVQESNNVEVSEVANEVNRKKKKNKKRKNKPKQTAVEKTESAEDITVKMDVKNDEINEGNSKKKNKKRKKSKSKQIEAAAMEIDQTTLENKDDDEEDGDELTVPMKKSKMVVNPNAITDKESDSEHESDNEIESENEEINKKVFAAEPNDEDSSDEDKGKPKEVEQKQKPENKGSKNKGEVNTEDEVKRTLFVGNVPFSAKCKKEIKKIFNKHGQIETIRIRTVPIKDGRYTPKLAVIRNELHPERTTVNVYVKFADEESVEKALAENNTVLNDHHLRVTRSSSTGAEHDPKCSIFLGNLPFAIEDETLREKFAKCGEIESIRIIRDKKTNAGKGFGYVNFASKDGVELALALTEEDLTIKNRIVRVKRCTQLTNKQKQKPNQGNQRQQHGNQRVQSGQRQQNGNQRAQSGNRENPGNQRAQSGQRQQYGNQRAPSGHRQNPSNQRAQSGQRQQHGNQRAQSGHRQIPGNQRWSQGFQRGNQGGQSQEMTGQDGAHRRIMHKRKSQDASGGDGPQNKRQKEIDQPNKEKKARKEFVGMTAEKKKKRKFDKGQKKKKALSEILTK